MKVLILSCNTGQGHNAAGRALCEQFLARGVDCTFLDALSLSNDAISSVVSGAYVATVQKAPRLFGGLYKAGDMLSSDRRKSPIYLLNIAQAGALNEYIHLHGITTVVTPHLFPAEMLTHLRRKHGLQAKCYSVATDYTCIPFWEETEMDAYIVPHRDLLHEYIERGLPADRLIPLGIPASERFSQPMRTQEARDLLNLPREEPIFLVMTGSMGYGGAIKIACGIASRLENALTLVLTGRNELLKNEIDALAHPRIRSVSFTDQIPAYMRAADVVLTKPGGLTSTEAAVRNVPLVLTDPIPGCETRNAAFFESHGMARTATCETAAACAISLVKDAVACKAMLAAQERTIRAHAARDSVDWILSMG